MTLTQLELLNCKPNQRISLIGYLFVPYTTWIISMKVHRINRIWNRDVRYRNSEYLYPRRRALKCIWDCKKAACGGLQMESYLMFIHLSNYTQFVLQQLDTHNLLCLVISHMVAAINTHNQL